MAHEARERYAVNVGARGRVVLPAPVRARLGLREGDRLVLTVEEDGTLHAVSLRDQVEAAKGLYGHLAGGASLVDELIAERRREAERE
ncbi:MAG TPA: AbrB/MazE/SpoVT family DNA-binding domain-containing protein [Chloroflexota bacterium]|jgi:AbrB family looped-hinge helix DNA binding protein|nr:AbrB/MazE/SpoVT family DNA-binding domain-containing protein [Chloroflexota bacterium]